MTVPDAALDVGVLAAGGYSVAHLLGVLAAVFVATKMLGELAQRLGQPSVLGEIIAGVMLGGSVLGVVNPADPALHAMAQIGLVLLLFGIGVHTEMKALLRVGRTTATVGLAMAVVPLLIGYGAAAALGASPSAALVCGTVLCATSVGMSARALANLRMLDSNEGRVALGAGVIVDIVALIILAIVVSTSSRGSVTPLLVVRTTLLTLAFVGVAAFAGGPLAALGYLVARKTRTMGVIGLMSIAFAFVVSWLADFSGLAMFIGAFVAGLVLDDRHDRREIEKATTAMGHFFTPIVFACVGAAVNLRAMEHWQPVVLALVLILGGVVGKLVAGFSPVWFPDRKLIVGLAMLPSGEVGAIFAQIGLGAGVLSMGSYGAVMASVLLTTLVASPMLRAVVRSGRGGVTLDEVAGGIEELSAGVWQGRAPTPPQGIPRATPSAGVAWAMPGVGMPKGVQPGVPRMTPQSLRIEQPRQESSVD